MKIFYLVIVCLSTITFASAKTHKSKLQQNILSVDSVGLRTIQAMGHLQASNCSNEFNALPGQISSGQESSSVNMDTGSKKIYKLIKKEIIGNQTLKHELSIVFTSFEDGRSLIDCKVHQDKPQILCPQVSPPKLEPGCSYEIVKDSYGCDSFKITCEPVVCATLPAPPRPMPGCYYIPMYDPNGCQVSQQLVCQPQTCPLERKPETQVLSTCSITPVKDENQCITSFRISCP